MNDIGTAVSIGNITNLKIIPEVFIGQSGIPMLKIPLISTPVLLENLDSKEYVLKKIRALATTASNIGSWEDKNRIRKGSLPYLNEAEMSEWLTNPDLVGYQLLYYTSVATNGRVQYQLSLMVDIAKKLRASVLEVHNAIMGK
jgi:hypothetical protein